MNDTRLDPTPREQREAIARAMKILRERAGPNGRKLAAQAAADRIGKTRQTWDNWEKGDKDIILRQDVQRSIQRALNVTPEQFEFEYLRALGQNPPPAKGASLGERAGATFGDFPVLPRLILSDDLVRPWASSGTEIVYDPDQWPREGDGCVVTVAGRKLVKIFVRADDEAYHVRELSPPRDVSFPRDEASIGRVIARIG